MRSTSFHSYIFVLALALMASAQAAPQKTLGNAKAPTGGTFSINLSSEPTTLHPLNSVDVPAREVQGHVLESLLTRNDDSYEWEPSLAESWNISKDKKVFTFKLRRGVKWHDGQDFTAADVKFSFDSIFDGRFQAAAMRSYYESIEKVEVIDDFTVKFTAREVYWGNFDSAAALTIIPKHLYNDDTKKDSFNRSLIGTGPYVLDKYEKGKRIVLRKNPTWWGKGEPANQGQYNFDQISMRFVKEENVEFEMFKKGDLDYIGMTGESYMQKATGPEFGKTVEKVKTTNSAPKSFGFIGWNLKNELFTDKNVRVALAHLMNRRLMIEKFLYNLSVPATGPWHQLSEYASPKVKVIEFDTKKAADLLKKAGWADADKNGILEKTINGKKREFRFQLLSASPDSMKYFTIYKEDARKAGIDIDVKLLEWNAFVKLIDERKFEAMALAWGGGAVDWEPKQIWHSKAIEGGGSNFVSYNNPQVDKLIDDSRKMMDKKKRVATLRRVYEMIASDAPYLFFFNAKYTLYGVSKKVGRVKDTYNYTVGTNYWWKLP